MSSSPRLSSRLLIPVRRRLDAFGRRPAQHLSRLGILVIVALALRAYADAPAEHRPPVPEAVEQCAACHEDQVISWSRTIHRRSVGAPQLAADRQGCGACHTGLAQHLEDASQTPPYLSKLPGAQTSAICLSCHKGGQQMMWSTTSHSKLQQGCLSCHDPHGGEGRTMLRREQPELCDQCHPQQVAESHLPSHHPIPEGKMTCTDCHNVHGDERNLLPAASNPEMCYRCHAEKAGPFVNEHPPVTEDCTICHKPHGAQNDRLLRMDEPMLCLQCHPGHHDAHRTPLVAVSGGASGQADAIQGIQAFYNRCTSCHSRIHGTDLSSGTGNGTFMPGSPPAADLPLGRTSATNSGPYLGLAGVAALGLQGDGASWGFSDLELGTIDEDGNPTYVREYDGKNYEFPRFKVGVDQYAAKSDFHFRARDFAAGDEEAETYFGTPNVSANVKYNVLTHRQPRFNDVGASGETINIGGQLGVPQLVSFTDLTGGKNDFQIERKTTDINLAARHPKLRQVKWLASYWRESEKGAQQFLFLDRCGSCHKVQTAEPINRVTTEAAGGAEIELDKGAVRYLHTEGRFENLAPEQEYDFAGVASVFSGPAPLFGVADNRTRADEVRLVAVPNQALALNGLWSSKQRGNLFNGSSIDIDSAGGGASWRLAPDLRLVASFLSADFDNNVRSLEPEATSRERRTTRTELRYSGLPWTALSAGYKRETVDRTTERAFVPEKSKTNTWMANAVTSLPNGLGLNVRYRKSDTDVTLNFDPAAPPDDVLGIPFGARWIAPPTDESFLSAVATYGVTPRLLTSLLYSKLDRTYDVGVPLLGVARRSDDDIKTWGAEAFYSAGRRTRLSAGFYMQEGDATSDATYGVDDFVLQPPLTPGAEPITFPLINSLATFSYDATILRLDASHWVTPRLRVFGRFGRTRSDGAVVAHNLGDYADQNPDLNGLALVLNPFDITLEDKWIGMGYLLDPFTEIALSFERRDWENARDHGQDGSYDLWRLGLRKAL